MTTTDLSRMPTWVYRLFCEHGGDLYVGIAVDLERRLTQHRATKKWWPEVAEVNCRLVSTRLAALKVEAMVIQYARPKYNIVGVTPLPKFPTTPIAGRIYNVRGGRLVDQDDWAI